MKMKGFQWAFGIVALSAIAAGYTVARPQGASPVHFNGVINDYSPATTSNGKTTGPWELRGTWSLDLQGRSGKANFFAALTMETSDYGIAEGIVNPTDPGTRSAHTHHITMIGATVTDDPKIVSADCPSNPPGTPLYTPLFELIGSADVAGNGGSPFGVGVLSPLQVCIDGGPNVQFSNITLMFQSKPNPTPASTHFGPQPIRGVVSTLN